MSEEKFNQHDNTTLENYANTMLDKVSKNVVKYRKQKGFSQAQLAKAIGYKSAAYLGKAEVRKENHHFNIKQVAKISKVLEIDIDSFFK